jgi:hypothetical protein
MPPPPRRKNKMEKFGGKNEKKEGKRKNGEIERKWKARIKRVRYMQKEAK